MAQEDNYILNDEAIRQSGKLAQKNNITAAKIVAETIRTTLGPKGMDKMLVDSSGNVTVTNDGVTILKEMEIEHPAAKMIVEVAKTQEDEVGDGTTTAVVFSGELLKQAEKLLEKNVHPSIIVKGYRKAAEKAQEILVNLAKPISLANRDLIVSLAMTAMTGKGAESAKEALSNLVLEAILLVENKGVDRHAIKLEKRIGGNIESSELIKGLVLDKEKAHSSMPTKVKDAKILLLNTPLEVRDTEIDAKISITSPTQMQEFLDMEEKMLKGIVEKVLATNANVIFCQKGIDDLAQYYLAKKGILAMRRVKHSDMEALSKATGAQIVNNLEGFNEDDLGNAGEVEEVMISGEGMIYVKDCINPKIVTILVRGATEHVVLEAKRALEDAIGDVCAAINQGKVVAGAGAIEIELEKALRSYAQGFLGKEQLAIVAFAESLEVLPQTLAENAGLDPIEVIAALKASHDKGNVSFGINVFSGQIVDSWHEGVVEPLKIKTQAISSATEVATMILRIDDVIASKKQKED